MPILPDRRLERPVVRRARVFWQANDWINSPGGHLLVAEVVRRAPGAPQAAASSRAGQLCTRTWAAPSRIPATPHRRWHPGRHGGAHSQDPGRRPRAPPVFLNRAGHVPHHRLSSKTGIPRRVSRLGEKPCREAASVSAPQRRHRPPGHPRARFAEHRGARARRYADGYRSAPRLLHSLCRIRYVSQASRRPEAGAVSGHDELHRLGVPSL
jgi:hypothetical protein